MQQLCVIHQIRNSTKYVSCKDLKPLMADLKLIYQAPSEDDALFHLEELREKWAKNTRKFLNRGMKIWRNYPPISSIPRKSGGLIYTTNAVEGFHRMLRKYTKTKTIYPTDDAVRKSVYLSIVEISKKWSIPIRDWGTIIGQLLIFFGDRFSSRKTA